MEGGVKSSITIDNDKSELLIVCEERPQWFGLELVAAVVHELVDWPEWLKVEVDLLLSVVVLHENNTAENTQSIGRRVFVKLNLYQ